jgi:hypothetical protein
MNTTNERWISLIDFPDAILGSIAEHLRLVDLQHLCTCCRTLRRRSDELWSQRQAVGINSHAEMTIFVRIALNRPLTRLRRLDCGPFASDEVLQKMIDARIPSLQAIYMVESLNISDTGLHSLSFARACAESLEEIDITYCQNTSYAGTFCVRDNFPNLRLIRRQPKWMDGRYETPFPNDGLHTYYADGSFEFERQTQSCGFVVRVCKWYEANPYFVFDKLQYSNPGLPPFFPADARFFYRPGVSLLRLDESEVLVGQKLRGLNPPKDYPRSEHAQLLPEVKASIYFTRSGTLLSEDDPEHFRYFMVSRMRVFPLLTTMPPYVLSRELL